MLRQTGSLGSESCADYDAAGAIFAPKHVLAWWVAAALVAGVVYYGTMAPGVLWQDSGMAQIRVLQGDYHGKLGLALSHPLFYMVAAVFQKLPFADSAYKVNLLAVVCGMFTVANVFLLLLLCAGVYVIQL